MRLKIMVPCHFGLEAVCKREIYDLGYEPDEVTDGRITFTGDAEAVVRSNIGLRSAERVLIPVGSFKAVTFDEMFEAVKALNWEDYIPSDGKFWVTKASSVKSKLFSPSDIQSLVKKAIVDRLSAKYGINGRMAETGASFPIRVFVYKDVFQVTLDTTGDSLHKRGYRPMSGKAPLSETLAASLIGLTPWHKDRILLDPFCGSGTIPIEAAMMAANIAPGVGRHFTAEAWTNLIEPSLWKEIREEARSYENTAIDTNIQGFDIDESVIDIARENAKRAGVDKLIHFQRRALADTSHSGHYGFIISNPPYGERLEEKSALPALYAEIGRVYEKLSDWSMYLITSYEDAEKHIGKKADKNRKIYNGMIKTYYYQFMGPKPPRAGGQ